jgi:hypothetical protein
MKASAVGLLLVLAGGLASQAFNFTYNSAGNAEHWNFNPKDPSVSTNVLNPNTHAIRFYIASDGYSTTNTANELNAVRNSFGQWQSVPNTIIKFEEAGLVAPGYDINTSDNTNVVYWAKTSTLVDGGTSDISGALGVTFTSFTVPANSIQQFDIVLNGVEESWFTDFNDQNNPNYFVEGVLVHELGHALGLRHASIGGATLLYAAGTGVDTTAGLSMDEVAFGRTLYPSGSILSTLGNLKGTVTKDGLPVLGAAVVVEGTNGNLAGGTVTLANGTYILNALPPGSYNVRVAPLDPINASGWLIQGPDISSPDFDGADTSFLPTTNSAVTLAAGTTNSLDFAVTAGDPAFRITNIRRPTANPRSYSIAGLPVTLVPGQSNRTIGVFSDSLPASGATFTITGDGLTLGAPTYQPAGSPVPGLNGISMSISVASNATPGLRTFVVQQGANRAYANGYLEVLPLVADYNFDGLDDVFQRRYFFPFTSTNAAPNADPDHDGMVNSQEYVAGTDPTNAASLLELTSVTEAGNGTTVTWQSVTNRHYQVMSRTNLAAGTWQNVGGVFTPTGTNSSLLDATATNGLRFYRVQVLP